MARQAPVTMMVSLCSSFRFRNMQDCGHRSFPPTLGKWLLGAGDRDLELEGDRLGSCR